MMKNTNNYTMKLILILLIAILNYSYSYCQNEIIINGDTGVFISSETLQEINHKLIEGKTCQEYSEDLELEYENLESHFEIAKQLIGEKNFQLDLQKEIYQEQKKKLKWWAVSSSILAGVLLVFHVI